MSQIYLSDLRDGMRDDIMRTIERNRPGLYRQIQDGETKGETVEIAIGEYYQNDKEYTIV